MILSNIVCCNEKYLLIFLKYFSFFSSSEIVITPSKVLYSSTYGLGVCVWNSLNLESNLALSLFYKNENKIWEALKDSLLTTLFIKRFKNFILFSINLSVSLLFPIVLFGNGGILKLG